ncbi:hypothetical protein [Paenibacillus whitsoniae]|uniref:Zf-HC2 domain-containing protein n=1 Tax=Paenibacillus whitsoniae TaxID=2496558 RepID=A0A430JDC6_9BACL|nr:hypothetical protein [Paenibacillus whitsoniae]RTE09005.1 hypothetical protein EJQ19_14665 [Paenibacillus whitsoniae]
MTAPWHEHDHFEETAWRQYVTDTLPASQRAAMEQHLYRCEACLLLYMACIEQTEELPVLEPADPQAYLSDILARTTGTKRSWYRSTLLHYGIAAAATLVLVASGFFHGLAQELGSIGAAHPASQPRPAGQYSGPPLSSQLVDRTFQWLDTLHNTDNRQGGSQP